MAASTDEKESKKEVKDANKSIATIKKKVSLYSILSELVLELVESNKLADKLDKAHPVLSYTREHSKVDEETRQDAILLVSKLKAKTFVGVQVGRKSEIDSKLKKNEALFISNACLYRFCKENAGDCVDLSYLRFDCYVEAGTGDAAAAAEDNKESDATIKKLREKGFFEEADYTKEMVGKLESAADKQVFRSVDPPAPDLNENEDSSVLSVGDALPPYDIVMAWGYEESGATNYYYPNLSDIGAVGTLTCTQVAAGTVPGAPQQVVMKMRSSPDKPYHYLIHARNGGTDFYWRSELTAVPNRWEENDITCYTQDEFVDKSQLNQGFLFKGYFKFYPNSGSVHYFQLQSSRRPRSTATGQGLIGVVPRASQFVLIRWSQTTGLPADFYYNFVSLDTIHQLQ